MKRNFIPEKLSGAKTRWKRGSKYGAKIKKLKKEKDLKEKEDLALKERSMKMKSLK